MININNVAYSDVENHGDFRLMQVEHPQLAQPRRASTVVVNVVVFNDVNDAAIPSNFFVVSLPVVDPLEGEVALSSAAERIHPSGGDKSKSARTTRRRQEWSAIIAFD